MNLRVVGTQEELEVEMMQIQYWCIKFSNKFQLEKNLIYYQNKIL